MVLDTNILIYAAKPDGASLHRWLDQPEAVISVVSRIEAFGFKGISAQEIASLQRLLQTLPEAALAEPVVQRAISLRQQRKMGLADAIIAATALIHDLPLVTRNTADFKSIPGLRLIDPFATNP